MTVQTSAGSTLAITSANPATFDLAGYGALTYTLIGEVTNIGALGKKYNVVKHNPVGTRYTKKFRGSYDNGTMAITMGRDTTDAGQAALVTAFGSDASATFCVTLQNGHKMYFQAMITELPTNVGTVDQITEFTTSLEINTDIVESVSP